MKIVHLLYFPHDIQKIQKDLHRLMETKLSLEMAKSLDRAIRLLSRGKLVTKELAKGGSSTKEVNNGLDTGTQGRGVSGTIVSVKAY